MSQGIGIDTAENHLFIHLNEQWSLREFPLHLNRTREKWDVYIGLVSGEEEDFRPSKSKLSVSNFQYASISAAGLDELVEASDEATAHDLSDQLRVRVIESTTLPSLPQRESLCHSFTFCSIVHVDDSITSPTLPLWNSWDCFVCPRISTFWRRCSNIY